MTFGRRAWCVLNVLIIIHISYRQRSSEWCGVTILQPGLVWGGDVGDTAQPNTFRVGNSMQFDHGTADPRRTYTRRSERRHRCAQAFVANLGGAKRTEPASVAKQPPSVPTTITTTERCCRHRSKAAKPEPPARLLWFYSF